MCALAAVLVGGWLLGPWFAFQEMRSAASVGDRDGLVAVADLGAVRAGLNAQLMAAATPPGEPSPQTDGRPGWWPSFLPYPAGGGLGGMADQMARAHAADIESQRLASPEGLAGLSAGRASVSHWGTRWFRIDVRPAGTPSGETPTTFTFTRRGWFDWRLTHVRLSAMALADANRRSPTVQR